MSDERLTGDGRLTVGTSDGIVVTGRLDDGQQSEYAPTRYSLALRRQASNRVRKAQGLPALPDVLAGSCPPCGGWGVTGSKRERCSRCNGRGEG